MDMLMLAVLVIGGLVFAVNSGRTRPTADLPTMDDTLPAGPQPDAVPSPQFEQRDALLSDAERSLYGALKSVAGNRFEVFVKPRLADVLLPARGSSGSERRAALEQMGDQRFDYVLCDKDSLLARYAIEVEQGRAGRGGHIDMVRQACGSAGLTLICLDAGVEYSAVELHRLLRE